MKLKVGDKVILNISEEDSQRTYYIAGDYGEVIKIDRDKDCWISFWKIGGEVWDGSGTREMWCANPSDLLRMPKRMSWEEIDAFSKLVQE